MEFPIQSAVLLFVAIFLSAGILALSVFFSYRYGKKVGDQEGYIRGTKEAHASGPSTTITG
ncbi:MAG TPA: hypothetical protein VK525_21630 [Candidatus Saccharimonadales bacterium]|nr:hypothetical protein [Candidatus Saccharimonadales bacterium]